MDKQKALELINSMPVKCWDTDVINDECVLYLCTVEDNNSNRVVLKNLGYTDEEIENVKSYRDGELDILYIALRYADYFDGEKFVVIA